MKGFETQLWRYWRDLSWCMALWGVLVLSANAQVPNPFGRSLTETPQVGGGPLGGEGGVRKPSLGGDKNSKKREGGKGDAPGGVVVTTIVAQSEGAFDQKTNQAVFKGDVVVTDPRFSLNCDQLTAVMKRAAKEGAEAKSDAKEGGAAAEAKAEASKAPSGSGSAGIETLIAEGRVVITQEKRNEKGELERSVARAQKAVFDADSGDVTLSGWPQLETAKGSVVSEAESTVIIFNRRGTQRMVGPTKTVIRSNQSDDGR